VSDARDVPLFVPYGDEHVAAVLTLPDGDPRGLVLLLQLFGVGRSHKNGLWTRTSRSLARRGLASVRIDYLGLGDSTGGVLPVVGWDNLAVGECLAVTEVAADLIGVESIAVAGNCYGARTALAFAARLWTCVAVAVVPPGVMDAVLEPRRIEYDSQTRQKVKALALKNKVARRVLFPALRVTRPRAIRIGTAPRKLVPEVAAALQSTDLLFAVMGNSEPELRRALAELPARDGGDGGRVQVEALQSSAEVGSGLLGIQRPVQALITTWMDQAFQERDRRSGDGFRVAEPTRTGVPPTKVW
jgi:pimeloyl-ACP methyl ester carboxylesterase